MTILEVLLGVIATALVAGLVVLARLAAQKRLTTWTT